MWSIYSCGAVSPIYSKELRKGLQMVRTGIVTVLPIYGKADLCQEYTQRHFFNSLALSGLFHSPWDWDPKILNYLPKITSYEGSEITLSKLLALQRRKQAPGGQSCAKVILKVLSILGTSKPQRQPHKIQMVGSVILLVIFKVTIRPIVAIIIFPTSPFPGNKIPLSGNQAKCF